MVSWFCCKKPGLAGSVYVRHVGKNNTKSRGDRNAESVTDQETASTEYPTWRFAEMDPTKNQAEAGKRSQSVCLSKNDDYWIDSSVHSVRMHLGCDKGAEVGGSVTLFDKRLEVADTVSHDKPRSICEAVEHSGKNVPGDRTDEVISVGLSKIPLYIHYLLFVFCIASDSSSFSEIHSAYVGMMYAKETRQNRKLCRFSVTGMSGHAMIMGVLTRKGPRWNFRALGIPASGRTIHELLQNPKNLECLKIIPSYNPRMRQVTVNVAKGTDLAAKYVLGIFRSPYSASPYSASPYFIVTFKNNNYTSEHKPQTLEPEWKEFSFDMGLINEVETEALKVQVFDHNDGGADTFMGMIWISGCVIYHLGVGDHTFWFKLRSSKEETYRHKKVSGKILIHFRIKESLQNFDWNLHPSVQSTEIDRDLQNSGTRPGIENNPKGKSSVEYADLGRELVRTIVSIFRKNSVPMPIHPAKSTAERIAGRVALRSKALLEDTSTDAIPETEAGRKASFASTHWEGPKMVVNTNPEIEIAEETTDSQSTSNEDCSSLSDGIWFPTDSQSTSNEDCSSLSDGIWFPDAPYISRDKFLAAVRALKQGQNFADDYVMGMANFAGRPHLRLAEQRFGRKESVVLKFYWLDATLEKTIEMHAKVTTSEHVCRIQQTLKTSKTGHPPCLAFEMGTQTLRDWLRGDRASLDRRWSLCQILTGLRDLHAEGIVHCELNPAKVVFFPNSVTWKLIDLDGAQKAGERTTVCATAPYTAPEVLRQWDSGGELPVARPSSDIWSCGILAYEVLTGVQMFEDEFPQDEICVSVLEERVEERLDSIANDSHQEAISKFLKLNPVERWSAADALQHLVFQSDSQTTCSQV